jgi:hypothetical protein
MPASTWLRLAMPDVQFNFRGITEYTSIVQRFSAQLNKELGLAFRDIATEWQRQAKLRIPVETGVTRNTVLSEHGRQPNGEWFCAVGSNQKHAKFIEFGTKHIADGAVKALGTGADVTDAQAIHSWPAKDATADQGRRDMGGRWVAAKGGSTSAMHKGGALRNKLGRFVKASPQEQMPWLRPSFMAIQEKVMGRLAKALFLK